MKNGSASTALVEKLSLFEPLIRTNEKENFLKPKSHQEPAKFKRELFLKLCPLSVIDPETLKLIQVLRLHTAIDHTVSSTGSAILLRSLAQPCTDLVFIRSKQDALLEIAANDKLRQSLHDFVAEYSKGESALFKFFNKELYALVPYLDLKKARKAAANITKSLQSFPKAESHYLRTLLANLSLYKGSSVDQMMSGVIVKTFKGMKSGDEVGVFTPKLKFIPHRFSKWIMAGPAVAAAPYIYNRIGLEPAISPVVSTIGLAWTGIYAFYSFFVKPVKDTGNFIEPLRQTSINDKDFSRAIDSVGMIDELLSQHQFADRLPHATTLPVMTDDAHHSFTATGLKNPVLAKENPAFVPNDVQMNGTRLSFISGPNSGGKTTICKSIVQNQLLAQMGAYVLAEKATINIADMISYQAPKFDGLQDDEGRFGTELSRTRDIFYATSPKSLVILDELAEGTTYEERQHESHGILDDFHTIGNNTVLVTHNHSLVDRFMEEGKGQSLMVEFNGEDPTYRVIPGISRVSHADRITKKINFSKADRYQYMKEKGYL